MATERQAALKAMLEQNPNHSFARYGLAMEFFNTGEFQNAIDQFTELIKLDPNYAAAYFHGGRTFEELGRTDEARSMYEKGIAVTRRTGDAHTQSELQAALDLLG